MTNYEIVYAVSGLLDLKCYKKIKIKAAQEKY
jgi:hypothetical protein